MAENRNQHFIPQFHLRRWSNDGRSVAVLNLSSGRVISRASIKGQCSKPYLYGRDEEVEEAIQAIEQAGAQAIREIIDSELPPWTRTRAAVELMTYLSFQWGRTPAAAAELEEAMTQATRRILGTPGVAKDERLRLAADNIRVSHEQPVLEAIRAAADTGHCLIDLDLYLVVNDSPVGFVTSDVAIAFHNQWLEAIKGVGTTGFAMGGLQVFMPLSPRHTLLALDGRVYKVGTRRGPRVVRFTDSAHAEALNALQYAVANQNVYFMEDHATTKSLDRLRLTTRSPRHLAVRTARGVSEDESSELLHLYHEGLGLTLRLPWLRLKRNSRRLPLHERLRSFRPSAVGIDRMARGPREHRPNQPTGSRLWRRVDD